MVIDMHDVSVKLNSTTSQIPGFKKNLRIILMMLLNVPKEEYPWKEFTWTAPHTNIVKTEKFNTFTKYLDKWSHFTVDEIKRLFSDDTQVLDLIDRACQRTAGGDTTQSIVDNINNARPTGTSKDATLRRLRKDAPVLLERVIAGELSANAAAIQAGFRKPTWTAPTEPESLAAAIKRKFGDEFALALKQAL